MDKVLNFLEELAENNNREWFHDNKQWYDESRAKVLFLTEVLINELGEFDTQIRGLQAKDCVFRIFRDVRFSKDKRPYKTNFGSFICKGGRKSVNPGYYFHIEPGGSFVGGGIFRPQSDQLRTIRNYLADHGDEFLELTNAPDFKREFPEMYDDKLKTAPKGFPKDHDFISLLRYKSFIFSKSFADSTVAGDNFVEKVVEAFEALQPVNSFLYEALAE